MGGHESYRIFAPPTVSSTQSVRRLTALFHYRWNNYLSRQQYGGSQMSLIINCCGL